MEQWVLTALGTDCLLPPHVVEDCTVFLLPSSVLTVAFATVLSMFPVFLA